MADKGFFDKAKDAASNAGENWDNVKEKGDSVVDKIDQGGNDNDNDKKDKKDKKDEDDKK
ncbi:hypothetical protein [Salinicoccus sp. YB14-2]|uniref:hypothetical protein n=1 Tax=Salinicoccus sp. YB14-2 TaxID=1572701 RepID=UPI0006909538|nr:hypothetical protein [Salinicoccus sp. YB14-2]